MAAGSARSVIRWIAGLALLLGATFVDTRLSIRTLSELGSRLAAIVAPGIGDPAANWILRLATLTSARAARPPSLLWLLGAAILGVVRRLTRPRGRWGLRGG